jgi:hypothetical protein
VIPALCEHLNGARADTGRAPLTGGIVIGLDSDPGAKVTQVLFDSAGRPQVVVKVARRASAEAALRAEHAMLRSLAVIRPAAVAGSVPSVVLLDQVEGRLVLATTVVPGGPMSVGYYRPGHVADPRRVRQDFALAGDWLSRFQDGTARGTVVVGDELFTTTVVPVFERFRTLLGWSSWLEPLLDRLAAVCHDLSGLRVPLVAVHGDFALGNVLVARDRVTGVVDWELGRPSGLPFTDVLKFVSSYGSFLDRAGPARGTSLRGHPGWGEACARWGGPGVWPNKVGFLHAHLGRGWFPELVREFVAGHLRRLGAPAEVMQLVLPLFVAEQATVLDNPVYRAGYRSVLATLWSSAGAAWGRPLEQVR